MSQTTLQKKLPRPHKLSRLLEAAGILFFLGLFLAQSLFLALHNSTISDEVAHIGAGYAYVKFGNFELNPEHPPLVKQIAAIPLMGMELKFPLESEAWKNKEQWAVGRQFLYTLGNPAEKMIAASRGALVGFPLVMGIFLYLACRRMGGVEAGMAALAIFALLPEFLAHSLLVTTDFAAALFFFGFFAAMCRYHDSDDRRYLLGAGVLGGLALVSKFSMMQILPLVYVIAGFHVIKKENAQYFRISKWLLIFIAILAFSHKQTAKIFVLPLLYFLGQIFFSKIKLYQSKRLQAWLAISLSVLSVMFAVVMIDYFEPSLMLKLDPFKRFFRGWTMLRDHSKGLQHEGFLFSRYSVHGWWYYYVIAMLVKIPLPVWALALIGAAAALKKRLTPRQIVFWILPPSFYFFIAAFVNHVNIGVRHALPLYPFFVMLAVSGWMILRRDPRPPVRLFLPAFLAVWMVVGTWKAFPHYLSYFNELAVLAGGGEKILSDSNVSWGQDLIRLRDYVKQNQITQIRALLQFNTPDEMRYYNIPFIDGTPGLKSRLPGTYVMDVYTYHSLTRYPEYAWLKALKPDTVIGGSLWIFKL